MRRTLADIEARIARTLEDESAIEEGVQHIDIDLSNTVAEFVETTGKQPSAYYRWRRSAKWARYRKMQALERKRQDVRALEYLRTQLSMRLYAVESGYRGADPEELLRAAYHLLMDVLARADAPLTSDQFGLVAAIREKVHA